MSGSSKVIRLRQAKASIGTPPAATGPFNETVWSSPNPDRDGPDDKGALAH